MSWIVELLLSLGIALFLRLFVVNIARIHGHSMNPTLHHGDWALVWRLPYCFRPPRRHDVVICHYPGRRMKRCKCLPQAFVKRVIGLPGDTIEFIEGTVYVNGTTLEEGYLDPRLCRSLRSRPARRLEKNEYFVMGDNRDHSNDSRSVGPIRRHAIRGRVVHILWSPGRPRRLF